MKSRLPTWIPVILFMSGGLLTAQNRIAEKLLENAEPASAEILLEKLEHFRKNPVNLNTAGLAKLEALPFFSLTEAAAVYRERRKRGPYLSLPDFLLRLGPVLSDIDDLAGFVCFHNRTVKKSLQTDYQSRLGFRKSAPGTQKKPIGPDFSFRQRVRVTSGAHFTGALLTDKDRGERSICDHYAGYAEIRLPRQHTKIIVGDYSVETGQGLVSWGPYGTFKGGDPAAAVLQHAGGIKGYASSDENRFFRGTAVSSVFGPARVSLYWSRNSMDAVIPDEAGVTSLPADGLHCTESAIRRKNNLTETVYGGAVEYALPAGDIGITRRYNRFSTPFQNNGPEKKYFAFTGNDNTVTGLFAHLGLPFMKFAGEWAFSASGGRSFICTAVTRKLSYPLVISLHHFDPDFHNIHSNCLNRSPAANSRGIYVGTGGSITPKHRFSLYCELNRTPWRTYRIPVHDQSSEICITTVSRFPSALWLTMKFRMKSTLSLLSRQNSPDASARQLIPREQLLCRLQLDWRSGRSIRHAARFEAVTLFCPSGAGGPSAERRKTGLLWFFDTDLQGTPRLDIRARIILFRTDDYDSRIYSFVKTVPGAMGLASFYDTGISCSISARLQAGRNLRISAAFSARRSGTAGGGLKNGPAECMLQADWSR